MTPPTAPGPTPTPQGGPRLGGGGTRKVRCPICLAMIDTDSYQLFERDANGTENLLDVRGVTDPLERAELMRNAVVHCPSQHSLPVDYVRYSQPVVIGLVGSRDTGKSTLLAMMIEQIDKNGLRDYGFRATPLMQDRHELFRKNNLERLTGRRQTLTATAPASEGVDFADGVLLISGNAERKPVIFFDVGGESFREAATAESAKVTRFIQSFTALIFVVDSSRLTGQETYTDPTFRIVSDRIKSESGDSEEYHDKPAAIILAKADTLRFEPPIARWLTQENGSRTVDPRQIREESRDIYAYLYQHEAEWCLTPFDEFKKCTLHAVSATGSNSVMVPTPSSPTGEAGEYLRSLRPRRVLEPLVAILAMTGVISGPDAEQVGTI